MTSGTDELFLRHFGVGSEQFKREMEAEWEQATPKERAEFESLVDQANAVLPDMHAAVDRIDKSLTGTKVMMDELRRDMAMLDERVASIKDRLALPASEVLT